MKNTLGTEDEIKRWDQNAKIITANFSENGDLLREVLLNPPPLGHELEDYRKEMGRRLLEKV